MMINQPSLRFFCQRILIGFVKMLNLNFGQRCFAHPAGYSTSKTVPNIYLFMYIYIYNIIYIYMYIQYIIYMYIYTYLYI